MISDNAIPHCGLELGCCSRQIPYDLVAHDKMVHDEAYQQGRADAIDEVVDGLCCNACFTNLQKDAIRKFAEQLKENA